MPQGLTEYERHILKTSYEIGETIGEIKGVIRTVIEVIEKHPDQKDRMLLLFVELISSYPPVFAHNELDKLSGELPKLLASLLP